MVNKDIILEAIFSNKTTLHKFITSVIQLLTANDEQNVIYFISKLYKNKRMVKKSKTANKKRYKGKEYAEEHSFYNNNCIII